MKIKDITNHLEQIAPKSYQESYDNSGLLVGNPHDPVNAILTTLDVTEAVIDEAIAHGCNLIVAHHPLIFKGLKKLTGQHWVDRCVIKAIRHNLAIYAIHTNLDHVHTGVNRRIVERIGLKNVKILDPKRDTLTSLVTFIPVNAVSKVVDALYAAGAGHVGNYDHCSFQVDGMGTFRPGATANPHIGSKNHDETVNEKRVEVLVPTHRVGAVMAALYDAHPYEEVAHYLTPLDNLNQEAGAGMVGELPEPMEAARFLSQLKTSMGAPMIRHTRIHRETVSRIAVCGGAGSFLLSRAMAVGADVFITGDFKYHDFFEADEKIIIADIGHYESEQFTKHLLYDILQEKFTNIAVRLTEVETNPINYL